jgi:hypothetical protein
MNVRGDVGFKGKLKTRVIRAPRPRPMRMMRIPGVGRVGLTRDIGDGRIFATQFFSTHLTAIHRGPDGQIKDIRDLGSGLVTNIGVLSMANDYAWSAQLNLSTLGLANQHASGTGATAAAATDFQLQTPAAPTATTAVTGTQSLVPSGTAPKYQTVATLNYTSTLTITEWGLFSLATLSSTTGTPFTAATATTWTDTGSVQTASSATVRGLQGTIVVPGTTAVWGLNLSNTTHVGTIPAWYNQSNGAAGSTPGGTEAFSIKPVMWDHRVFTGIGVNNGDSIQFTYQLQINSGG